MAQDQGIKDTAASGETDQYFSAVPSSSDVRHQLSLSLQGHAVTVEVSHGVFSSTRLDLGTSVLLRHVPQPPAEGDILDMGCGWGPIALALGMASPHARIWAVDVNERALDLTRSNARANHLGNIRAVHPDDVAAQTDFDCIWSNPPIRVGKNVLHELLLAWIPRLKPGGAAYLVVQKNLGADSLIAWLGRNLGSGFDTSKYASSKGYRIIEVLHKA
ncbi:MAG: class I SAM-dependent methyltransferase [Bifidobacterium sp.]|jgi:16S rRNA G1207 methylase RsmC|nr:class I SAM-dependent methyltransferase [Bifidobacterium sp.]MCI1865507.1 class I SAM-dependent methyltransferase [Bifidobacterium sp.]